MNKHIFAFTLLVAGCADDDKETCSLDHRAGTYYATAIENAGDCGPLDAQVVYVTDWSGLAPGCELLAADLVSEDQCTLARDYVCDFGDGVFAEYTGWTEELDGDTFAGQSHVDVYDADGNPICSSTYSITFDEVAQ